MSYVKQAYVDFGCTPGFAGDIANKVISNRIKLHYPCTFELNNIKQKVNNNSEAILFCNVLLNMYRVVVNEMVSVQSDTDDEVCDCCFGECEPSNHESCACPPRTPKYFHNWVKDTNHAKRRYG